MSLSTHGELDSEGNSTLDPDVQEAQRRFKRCSDWESEFRQRYLEDIKFGNADSDNGWQWPNDIRRNRDVDARPCLTINRTRQHCLQIVNDAKQNKPGIVFRPTGNDATKESADVLNDLVRRIEYQSNAQVAYDTASTTQVFGGLGYWRVITKYADDTGFEQDIFIERVQDPLTIYLDPDIKELDGTDARYGFVFDDVDRREFKEVYPEYAEFADEAGSGSLGTTAEWDNDKFIRVAEYFRKVRRKRRRLSVVGPDQKRVEVFHDDLPENLQDEALKAPTTREREVEYDEVEWLLIIGSTKVDQKPWPGRYIPIMRVIGEETVIERRMDRKGHVRALKDPQRMYNYWTSSAVEHVALQGKTPWLVPADTIEGYENYYKDANKVNHSFLPYLNYDEEGNRLDPPQRAQPPVMAPAYIQGMDVASREMSMASGQYDAQMGAPGNERSGKAINERQRQGDNATYHYIDNLAVAIRGTGKIILDLIPKVYDTPRVLKAIAQDGMAYDVKVDPQAQQAFMAERQFDQEIVGRLFNPNLGKYEVVADVGPAYATKRQEAFNAFAQLIQQVPQAAGVIGDIYVRAGDFPFSEEAAERLKRLVPPQALGKGPSPQEQQLMQQLQGQKELLQKMEAKLAIQAVELKGRSEKRDIDAYGAETDRLKALMPMFQSGMEQEAVQGLQAVIQQLIGDALQTQLTPIVQGNAQDVQGAEQTQAGLPGEQQAAQSAAGAQPPVPGARRAPDGNYYVPDPNRPGKYQQVIMPQQQGGGGAQPPIGQ